MGSWLREPRGGRESSGLGKVSVLGGPGIEGEVFSGEASGASWAEAAFLMGDAADSVAGFALVPDSGLIRLLSLSFNLSAAIMLVEVEVPCACELPALGEGAEKKKRAVDQMKRVIAKIDPKRIRVLFKCLSSESRASIMGVCFGSACTVGFVSCSGGCSGDVSGCLSEDEALMGTAERLTRLVSPRGVDESRKHRREEIDFIVEGIKTDPGSQSKA